MELEDTSDVEALNTIAEYLATNFSSEVDSSVLEYPPDKDLLVESTTLLGEWEVFEKLDDKYDSFSLHSK